MHFPAHLRRSKHGILHVRLTVPEDLRQNVGTGEIKRSLKMRDSVIAQQWALALTTRYGLHFEGFWQMVRRGYDPKHFDPKNQSTWPSDSEHVAGDYRTKINILTGEVEIETDPNNPDDHRRAMEAVQEAARQTRELLDNPVVAERLRLANDRDAAERAALAAEVQAGMQAQSQALVKQLTATLPVVSSKTVGEAVKQYEQSLNGMVKKTRDDYMFAVRWFEEFLGPTLPVSSITDDLAVAWKNELIVHYTSVRENKQTRKVARGHLKADPIAGLPEVEAKAPSVDKIIGRAHRFMKFCQKHKYFPRLEDLPTAGKTIETSSERKNSSFHEAFVPEDLRAMFAPENLLTQSKPHSKPHEFWIPLLCLFTGARIGELSQMYHEDIYQEANGFWVIAIRDKSGFQRVKTKAARRIIPLHPTLIELGFLAYVQDAKTAVPDSERVFPYLRYDKTNGFGDVPSEAFARYLDTLGIHEDEKTAHSFRKTANQRLKDEEVDYPIRCQLVGHEKEGVNEKVYATDISIPRMYEHLKNSLVFHEVDFTPLTYPQGRFVEVLQSEMIAAVARKRNQSTEPNEFSPTDESTDTIGVLVEKSIPATNPKKQKLANHLAAKAAREERAKSKRRGRPPIKAGPATA